MQLAVRLVGDQALGTVQPSGAAYGWRIVEENTRVRYVRRQRIAVLLAILMGPLALPGAAEAQTADALIDGAKPRSEVGCSRDVPIAVGYDAKIELVDGAGHMLPYEQSAAVVAAVTAHLQA